MNLLFLTPRHTDGFFTKRFRSVFQDVDPDVDVIFSPTNTSNQALADSAKIVVSEVFSTNIEYESGVFFPFNEQQIPLRWDSDQRRKIQFYIITAFFARMATARYGINVSASMSSPLCWLPPRPDNLETGKMVFHYPKMGDWTDNDMAKFIMYTIAAMSRDTPDLSDYLIIAECAPFEYHSRNGEKIVFVDDEGVFLWQMLFAQLVVSMSHAQTMEMVFLQEAVRNYGLPIILRSESMVHHAFKPETMLGKFSQPRSYTDIKAGLVIQDWYYRATSEQNHFVDIVSGIDNKPATGKITMNMAEYHSLFSKKEKRQDGWEESLVRNQAEQRSIMVDKMGKLVQRFTTA